MDEICNYLLHTNEITTIDPALQRAARKRDYQPAACNGLRFSSIIRYIAVPFYLTDEARPLRGHLHFAKQFRITCAA
jgi:hypothetical protein